MTQTTGRFELDADDLEMLALWFEEDGGHVTLGAAVIRTIHTFRQLPTFKPLMTKHCHSYSGEWKATLDLSALQAHTASHPQASMLQPTKHASRSGDCCD